MRKHTARHWLHACLDLLPVLLIPVFMIYSHRHDLSTDITIQQDVYKDFYQGVKNGKPLNFDDLRDTHDNTMYLTNDYLEVVNDSNEEIMLEFDINFTWSFNDHIYITYNTYSSINNYELEIDLDGPVVWTQTGLNDIPNTYSSIYIAQEDYETTIMYIYNTFNDFNTHLYIKDIQIFNLTTIFGSGNEPTKEVFESYLTKDYYDFGNNEVKVGTTQVPVKNNDIMSVFMDSFNNSINKYFNMGNVFGLGNVYQWFNVNVFGGNAPQVIYSVYNIVVYELVMDLLFLLYALFMWFIDMLKRLIEKPLDSIK